MCSYLITLSLIDLSDVIRLNPLDDGVLKEPRFMIPFFQPLNFGFLSLEDFLSTLLFF
jgi:hypothetical protein